MSARTIAALQIGLECAEQVLAERKLAYAGYPHRWSADEAAVSEIRAALADAQPVQEPTLPDGRLHADGYFTWNPRHPGYKMDKRTPCDFYLAAPPQPVPLTDDHVNAVVRSVQPHLDTTCKAWRRLTGKCRYWLEAERGIGGKP